MPDPKPGQTQEEFMKECVPMVMDDGTAKDNDQAVAICMSKWEHKSIEAKAITKTEADGEHPASDYLIVEDLQTVTTWHLRVKDHGTPDHGLMGNAWAALHSGFRGNKYEGPNKQEAIRKLTALYESEKMPIPEKSIDVEELKVGAAISQANHAKIQATHDLMVEMGADCAPQPMGKSIDVPYARDNALKTISKTDDELRVGNYMTLFGGRDLTGTMRKNPDGSSGEFFSPNTDFESDYTKTNKVLVDWEHGLDPDDLGITDDDLLGYVDWKTARKDEKGLFVERVLNRRQQYVQWIEELVEAGLIGNSTEASKKGVRRAANGEILRWPIKRDTLTVWPAEPRMLTENQMTAIKNLADRMPSLKTLITAPAKEPNKPIVTKELEMADLVEEKIDLLETAKKEAQAYSKAFVEELKRAMPADVKTAFNNVAVTHDEADTPFAKFGDLLHAVKQATLTQGRELAPRLKALNLKALGANELIGSEGGFLLEPSFAASLLTPLHDTGAFSSRANKIPIGPNSNGITVRAVDEISRVAGGRWGGIQGYRLAEAGTKTASNPTFRLVEMRLKKYAVVCYATEELLQDTTALAGVIQQGCSEELDFMVNDDIFEGVGAGGPLGIMASSALITVAKEAGQAAGTIVTQNVLNMWRRCHPASKGNSVWFINTDVTPQLYTMSLSVGTGGLPMFMLPGSLPNSPAGTLMGRPVVETEFNQTLGTAGDILLADMTQYAMIDRDVAAASSIHVQFLTDQVAYRFVYRCDGQPKIAAPLTPFHGTNTLSPFVALATRA